MPKKLTPDQILLLARHIVQAWERAPQLAAELADKYETDADRSQELYEQLLLGLRSMVGDFELYMESKSVVLEYGKA